MQIRPVVIGTAGHIDHGKSTLVRALTGIDPDRLKEERERGLTIDLGFAPLELSDGRRVGLVDVPGHERFIRNMVAGATGVDMVVLVVAADDGVMPQTREHLAILELVGVDRGMVALTKIDMVDPELVELAEEDIHDFVEGTFLEDAPVMSISAHTGEGLEAFKAELERQVLAIEPKSNEGVFRMPIQRVFSLHGIGTVVTGIPVSGEVAVGQEVEVLPGGRRAKVRGIQAYGEKTDKARAGHSSALNLTDVDRGKLERGAVVATPGYFRPISMVGARLTALRSLDRPVQNRMRVRLHTGTHDARGELILLDKDELLPGEEGLVQVRLDEPVVSAPGDRFVLRLLSPVMTLGGGIVLEESRHRLKRFKRFVIEELGRQEESLESPKELLASVLARRGAEGASLAELSLELKRAEAELVDLIEELRGEGRVASPGKSGRWLAAEALEGEFADLTLALDRWFGARPHRSRMDLRDLRRELGADKKRLASLLKDAAERGLVEELPGGWVRPCDYEAELPGELVAALARLEQRLDQAGFQPESAADLPGALGLAPGDFERLVEYAVDRGELVVVGDFVFTRAKLAEAEAAIVANCKGNSEAPGQLAIPALRDALGTSRKYLIPLLEFFDNAGLTARSGGSRILKRR
jgi:selenocysteine-specific elongation factor